MLYLLTCFDVISITYLPEIVLYKVRIFLMFYNSDNLLTESPCLEGAGRGYLYKIGSRERAWGMFIKYRPIPAEVIILRILKERMKLSEKERLSLTNKEKGYEGEVKFDALIQHLDTMILNDLLLEVGDTLFQIDTLIIFSGKIYLFDVKTFEGEYCYEDGIFKYVSGSEKKDPLLQLTRCQSLLRQLLEKYRFNFPIEAYLVYINPEFTLFQPFQNPQIILPTQVNSFIKKLSKLPPAHGDQYRKLADLLISLHITENPYTRLPKYDYNRLKKQLNCCNCHSFSITVVSRSKISCKHCGYEEGVEVAVLRSLGELRVLFPKIKITTKLVHEWCGGIVPTKTIRWVLKKNFNAIGNTKERYFE